MENFVGVCVKIDGKSTTVVVQTNATVDVLFVKISEKTKTSTSDITLYYQGQPMVSSKTVADYGIRNGTEVVLVKRMVGGALTQGEMDLLRTCAPKEVGGVANCPSIRACPKCYSLVYHVQNCKQMSCSCGHRFCFICLRSPDPSGYWPCGGHNEKCYVAGRQA